MRVCCSCAGGEIFLQGLAVAQSRLPEVALSQMRTIDIPIESAFDGVGAFDVLEHIAEDERAIRQLFQAALDRTTDITGSRV